MVSSNVDVVVKERKTFPANRKQKRRNVCDRNENELTTKTKRSSFKERVKRSFRIRGSKSDPIEEVAITRSRKRKLSFLFCSFRKSVSKPRKIVKGLSTDSKEDDDDHYAYERVPKEVDEDSVNLTDDVFDPDIRVTSYCSDHVEGQAETNNLFNNDLEDRETETGNTLAIEVECAYVNEIDDGIINDTQCQSERDVGAVIAPEIDRIDKTEGEADTNTIQPSGKGVVDDISENVGCVSGEETVNNITDNIDNEVEEDINTSVMLSVEHHSETIDSTPAKIENNGEPHKLDSFAFSDQSNNNTEKRICFAVNNNIDDESHRDTVSTSKTDSQVVVSKPIMSSYNIKTRYFLTKLFNIKNFIWKTKTSNSVVIAEEKHKMPSSSDGVPTNSSNILRNNQAICSVDKKYDDPCRSSVVIAVNEDSAQKRSSIIISLNDKDRHNRASYLIPLNDHSSRSSFAFTLDDEIDLSELIDYANKTFDGGVVYRFENSRDTFGGSETNILENSTPLYQQSKNYDSGMCRSYDLLCTANRSSIRESLHLGDSEEVLIAEGPDIL